MALENNLIINLDSTSIDNTNVKTETRVTNDLHINTGYEPFIEIGLIL